MRWDELLKRLPEGNCDGWRKWIVGVEVGVLQAQMSAKLLSNPSLILYMVDIWPDPGDLDIAKKIVRFAGDRAIICQGESTVIAETFDIMVDFVFIDADHSYKSCSADIAAWWPKVKTGGFLSGHDYKTPYPHTQGVDKAVDEFVKRTGLSVEFGADWTWFIRKE